ncbi:UNVERIFIED_CONTAM: U-box domain-containing protein 7 [Sesamum angustifolium]|uniref:U-box domain-containing protein 7 n=1 Tax=Sesamum angustifolium TaxID=2727405 RepID=A0AAW2JED6_9LAMI
MFVSFFAFGFCSQTVLFTCLSARFLGRNKAAIVKAGAVHKMLKLIQSPNGEHSQAIAEAVVANFLGLSALDSNKPIIGSSGAIPFLVETLKGSDETVSSQAKQDSLRAIYNLSISPSNVFAMLETDLIPHLFFKLGDMDMNSPGCQEKASYILMVMAHKSYGDRQAMIEAGIVSSLLELTLLLRCVVLYQHHRQLSNKPKDTMKEDEEEEEEMMSQEKKAVKQLVQQSLQNNMKRMVKRANLPHDFVPSDHFKSLTLSSTSKSLPF